MARREVFGAILTRGIQRIKSCEANKPVSVIHDELGYAIGREGGSAISYWRQGFIPKGDDLANLAREIVKRSDLDITWLKQLLASAEYPYPSGLCNELFPTHTTDSITEEINRLLPRKAYRQFIGRQALQTEIMTLLNDPYGYRLITIDGMGGIGKTALAHVIASKCLKRRQCESVLWIGSATDLLSAPGKEEQSEVAFERILYTIGSQLDIGDLSQLSEDEIQERIHNRLCEKPMLVVLDNLDSFTLQQEEVVRQLEPILGLSKALLTSRIRFVGDLYAIHLGGLEEDDAAKFVRLEAKERRLHHVERAHHKEIESIIRASGGSPLAMKLVVGQLGHLPIKTVLTHLEEVKSISSNRAIDEYVNLYRTIYLPTWKLLSTASESLLISISKFESGFGISMKSIQGESQLTGDELAVCINELWRLSLLEVVEPTAASLNELRYSIHPLTQRFVCSDIVQKGLLK